MPWELNGTIAESIGFATHQNAVPVIRDLSLTAPSDAQAHDLRLTLEADPPVLQSKVWRIDTASPGETLRVADRDVVMNVAMLQGLSESLSGRLVFTLTGTAGVVLAEMSRPIELLAHNQWGGLGTMSELLPAFVMPNDPAVDRVLKAASDVLERAGRPGAIDGYGGGKRTRVWELVSAIWSAVAGLRLSYALPPASFERTGQKIRTPSQVLEGRIATCLDSALLFAAALEQARLNPVLVLTEGHAFVGVWLQPVEFATLITEEAAALRRRVDLEELLLFETTAVTGDAPASFSQAVATARREIADDASVRFEMAIDVRRARMQKIRPLSLALAGASTPTEQQTPAAENLEPAPEMAAFDVEVADTPRTPGDRILHWQRKLLNLTTSNALLNMRDGKSVVRLLCPDPGSLEDRLAGGGKIRIVPMPELDIGGRDELLYEQQTKSRLQEEIAAQAMKRSEVVSLLTKDRLEAALIELYRKARSDLEEGGANTLYLALGFLKWKKSPTEEKTYRAPLILLPVKLERKSALSGVIMTAHEDEARFNLTLLELLRQDFELTVPGLDGDLPTDESGIDVAGIWRTLRIAVRDMPGFEVVPDVALGTFSFAKYLMWKDLVDRAERLRESPIVRHLIDRDGSVQVDRGGFPRAQDMDAAVTPDRLFAPLPADSSQLVAVVASAEGRDFVLDGPPGTGKSQTIANMIAHNLALGRRVLFVAEKRAALEVVQRRLADKGLAPFCLELHSAKATKSAVLKQLDTAWTTRDTLNPEAWENEARETQKLRDALNDVVRLLHRIEPNGWTIHRAMGRTVRDAGQATPRLTFAADTRHGGEEMARFRDVAHRLGIAHMAVADVPDAFATVTYKEWSNAWQEKITAVADGMEARIDAALAAGDGLGRLSRLPLGGQARDPLGRLLAFAEACLDMHGHDLRLAFAADMAESIDAAQQALALIDQYRAEEAALSAAYAPEAARRIDIAAMQAAWAAASGKFWILGRRAQREVARALAGAGGVSAVVTPDADLPRLQRMRELLMQFDALAPRAAAVPGWAGLATDGARISQEAERIARLRAAMVEAAADPQTLAELRQATRMLVVDGNDMLAAGRPLAQGVASLRQALMTLDDTARRFDALAGAPGGDGFDDLRIRARAIAANGRRLRDWAAWRRVRDEAVQAELLPLVEAVEQGRVPAASALEAFEAGYARWFAFTRIDQEPLLANFMSGEQADRIARFRNLEDRMAELACRYIRAKLCGLIPDKGGIGKKDGYGVLKHQLQLQRPSKPIRKLAADMGDAFTRLAPCMLMSPLSIAQYLPADQALFDLVIFDEASQITPWDAIGAMARGRQVVIAGDPRQMPPSNNFARSTGVATVDDDTEADLPSILDECLAAGVPQHSLDWHYRSRHESLIYFSNRQYYDGKLVTFPAADTRPSAVTWQRVAGVYARGARTNPIEAQAIVDMAVARLRDPGFVDERGQALSLGIITMNAEQMRLVEDLLDKARRSYPDIEPHFDAEARLEPVCVRNLETVQGDERDVILLGVNFGPLELGSPTMPMTFGKLNASGGWRRLNVAATRARREMTVFTSFDPGMIDKNRTSAEGVHHLKDFIEYADRGPRALAAADKGSLGGADSPFEEAVTLALRRRGWTVVPQVGVSRFRIDLGIVHPDRPGDYLLGVECDGASYHSAATARDRDKVRAAILEGLGWKLLRVWSTDWWTDRERAADALHQRMEAALASDRAKPPARVADPLEPVPASAAEADQMEEVLAQAVDLAPGWGPDADLLVAATRLEPEVAFARQVGAGHVPATVVEMQYSVAQFSSFSGAIAPDRFHDPRYEPTLAAMIGFVLTLEAPIAEGLLVQRIARAHGFQRAGRMIRDRVMALAERQHLVEEEPGGNRFVWLDAATRSSWAQVRVPASADDIRQIEDIALAELRAGRHGQDAGEVARRFGVRRLSVAARARIESA